MPIKRKKTINAHPKSEELKQRLIEEWKHPEEGEGRPVILPEQDGRTLHLYVIWQEWEELSQLERSEIIMEAFSETHKPDEILNVTVAMGLTPAEAEQMGIGYE